MSSVAVIGVGLLGTALVRRLVNAGLDVVAYDIDESKLATISSLGARPCKSVADAARCEVIVLAVFNIDQVEQVLENESGLLEAIDRINASPIVLCCSTCDPDRLASLAMRTKARAARLLEVPISGSSLQVGKGEGVGLIGGDRALVDEAHAILDAICPRRHHLGEIGAGSRAKLAVNLILGLNRGAVAEGLVFAECLGLEREAFLNVARQSAAYSQVMDVQGSLMARRTYDDPQSRVDQSLKDFRLMLAHANKRQQRLPFAAIYASLLEDCVSNGEADWDNAAIAEAVLRARDGRGGDSTVPKSSSISS